MDKILFSRKSDDWATPKIIYKKYMMMKYYDPCPLNSKFDGLISEWEEKILLILLIVKLKNLLTKAL